MQTLAGCTNVEACICQKFKSAFVAAFGVSMRGITIITTGLFLFTGCFAFVNEAKAAPAGPHLLESKEPVCDTVLDEYRKLYFSDHNGAAISSLQYEGEEV